MLLLTFRYDEWVKADRIIWPVDKGGPKRKQKKKTKVIVISVSFFVVQCLMTITIPYFSKKLFSPQTIFLIEV